MTIDILTAVVKTATVAVELKRLMLKRKLHQDVSRQLYLEQFAATTKELEKVLAPVVEAQVDDYVRGLHSETKQFCPTGAGGGVDPTCSPGGSSYRFKIEPYDKEQVDAISYSIFGKVDYEQLAKAAGSPKGSRVQLETRTYKAGDIAILVTSKDDSIEYESRRLLLIEGDKKIVVNDGLGIGRAFRGQGLGTQLFADQVSQAAALGFHEIRTDAAQGRGENGYYTWPRLGYDKLMEYKDWPWSKPPESFGKISRVSDLMRTLEGRVWWKENGGTLKGMIFDLKPGSQSREVLDAYVKERASRAAAKSYGGGRRDLGRDLGSNWEKGAGKEIDWTQEFKRAAFPVLADAMMKAATAQFLQLGVDIRKRGGKKAFCPTGPGGGVDPSCGSGGGVHDSIKLPANLDDRIISGRGIVSGFLAGEGVRKKVLLDNGADEASIEKMDRLFDIHRWGGESQAAADAEIHKGLGEDSPFGKTLRAQVAIETAIAVRYDALKRTKIADRAERESKAEMKEAWEMGWGPKNADAYTSWEHQWDVEESGAIKRLREPTRFYRKGSDDKDILPTSLSSRGAQSHSVIGSAAQPHFSPDHSWTLQEMIGKGYKILGGFGFIGMGYQGESEVTWVKVSSQKSFTKTKSTATDWLDRNELTLPSDFVSDMPRWMQDNIAKQLKESFDQDYWEGMAQTTQDDIETVLRTMSEGESISSMAKTIKEKLGTEYYHGRARNIARTEAANALNGARWSVYDDLMREVGPQVPMKMQWLSVLGTTTRDTHAHLDGVPADKDGLWYLGGKRIPWPGHYSLPPGERCNCQCTISIAFGMSENDAIPLIQDYYQRRDDMELGGQRGGIEDLWVKQFCPTGPGGGIDPTCGSGNGSSRSALISEVVAAARSDRIERSFLVYPGGRTSEIVKGTGEGDDATVDHFRDPKTQIAGSNIEAVHTHPISQQEANDAGHKYTGLSTGDLANIHSNPGISKITAVDLDGTEFSLSRLKHDPDSLRDLWKRQREVLSDVHQRHLDQYIDGKITRDELKVRVRAEAREVIAVLEEEGFVSYQETRRSAKAFCPTGPGGGVDPTCSPGKASSAPAPTIVLEGSQITKVKPLSGGSNAPTYIEYTDGAGQTQKGMFKADGDEASSPYYQAFPRGSQAAREVTASLIGKELGLGDAVASTQFAEVGGRRGVLQNWINDTAQVGHEFIDANFKGDRYSGDPAVAGKKVSKILEKVDGIEDMQYFDLLTGNADRHEGNWMVKGGKVAMIDNGATFASNEHYIAEGNGLRRQPRLRTLESSPAHSTGMQPMSSKFAEGVQKLLKNRDVISEQMAANGLKSKEIDSFWKRAEFLSKTRVFGFSQDTLMEFARLSEGIKNPWD